MEIKTIAVFGGSGRMAKPLIFLRKLLSDKLLDKIIMSQV